MFGNYIRAIRTRNEPVQVKFLLDWFWSGIIQHCFCSWTPLWRHVKTERTDFDQVEMNQFSFLKADNTTAKVIRFSSCPRNHQFRRRTGHRALLQVEITDAALKLKTKARTSIQPKGNLYKNDRTTFLNVQGKSGSGSKVKRSRTNEFNSTCGINHKRYTV